MTGFLIHVPLIYVPFSFPCPGSCIRATAAVLAALLLSACTDGESAPGRTSAQGGEPLVVARIGEREITLAELDRSIQLPQHDLALAEYRLRAGALRQLLEREAGDGGGASAEWLLEPPAPPREELPVGGRPLRGNPDAPVTLSIFCSYQSPHCAVLQATVRQLLESYAGWLRLVHFDLPLRYHREGPRATAAVHCARQQERGWPYADGLYSQAQKLGDETYLRLARVQGLQREPFARCMEAHDSAPALQRDLAVAGELGLETVPVVFINGLYIRGPRPYEEYAHWVDAELQRLGHDSSIPHPQASRFAINGGGPGETDLPLVLTGTSVSSERDNSTALIAVQDAAATSFSNGSSLMQGVRLESIRADHVLLDNDGTLERLSLRGQEGEGVHVPLTSPEPRDKETMRRIEQPEGETRKLVAPSGVLPLGRKWLAEQLRNRDELEKRFVEAEHQVDGHNLLKLEGIEDSEFFAALGLEEGDVVVRVNDTWVHSDQNQLWDALTSGQVVDVTFMRNGLPQRIQYVVEERGYFEEGESGGDESGGSDTDE
ncbi:thioredoxin domain-containing protein [Microbulbifer sp. YPW16]|uniref:thioredoxin domain-containing protein n=1 Tax=Microbulbifer sp. YPW16 TaxID=2904242 RepID=UPI001E4D1D3A|nr:thioredoxin domain-containing protein [Microbulbifer sp. YPW16]UHQ53627.1 thioredoxin domain-containing protein [Microbulbifer sp. YPW16]